MNHVYLGDYRLDPPEDDDEAEFGLTENQRRQKEIDDFDPLEPCYGDD